MDDSNNGSANGHVEIRGVDEARFLRQRIVLCSLLNAGGSEIPQKLSRLLDFAPNSFDIPHGGIISSVISRYRDGSRCPSSLQILSELNGESLTACRDLANANDCLPLSLAELEAEKLLRDYQQRQVVALLGEAWQEAKQHPDKVQAVARSVARAVDRAASDLPDQKFPAIVDAFEFSQIQFVKPPQLINGLLHKGTKMVLGGGSKSFKTWVLFDCAVSVAYGIPWIGFDTTPTRVLYVNFEIPEEFFQERLLAITRARGVEQSASRLDIWNMRGEAAEFTEVIPPIIERIKHTGYGLVMLDPCYKLYGNTDENSTSQVAALLNSFERICVKTKAAVAFGAHYSKGNQSTKEAIDRISGSGAFGRDPDSILPFTAHTEKDSFVIEPILRNLPPVNPFCVSWQFPLMHRNDNLDSADLKQVAGRKKEYDPTDLLEAIKERTRDNPISIVEWSSLASMSRTTLARYAADLRSGGFIATIGDGQNSRKYITEKGLNFLSK